MSCWSLVLAGLLNTSEATVKTKQNKKHVLYNSRLFSANPSLERGRKRDDGEREGKRVKERGKAQLERSLQNVH